MWAQVRGPGRRGKPAGADNSFKKHERHGPGCNQEACCSGKTGGKSRSGRRLLTWETATGGGGVPSPQIPAPTASNIYITLFWHVRCELNLTSILLLLN